MKIGDMVTGNLSEAMFANAPWLYKAKGCQLVAFDTHDRIKVRDLSSGMVFTQMAAHMCVSPENAQEVRS